MSNQNQVKNNFWKGFSVAIGIIVSLILIIVLWFSFSFGILPIGQLTMNCEQDYKIVETTRNSYQLITGSTTNTNLELIKGNEKRGIFLDNDVRVPNNPSLKKAFEQKFETVRKYGKETDIYNNKKYNFTKLVQSEKIKERFGVFSRIEFDIIANCLEKNNYKYGGVLLYGTPQPDISRVFDKGIFICDDKSRLELNFDGNLKYPLSQEEIKNINYKKRDLQLGVLDSQNKLEPKNQKIEQNPEFGENEKELQTEFDPKIQVIITNFEYSTSREIIPKNVGEKLFDQNGIKNDYLQTCKNTNGKTIFDIFKE